MSAIAEPRAHARRRPLVDATELLRNTRHSAPASSGQLTFTLPHHESLKQDGPQNKRDVPELYAQEDALPTFDPYRHRDTDTPSNHRPSAISSRPVADKRFSEISATSTLGSDGKSKRKTHIGPWQLGKTLGKGATARVRMARHAVTGQMVAVKIMPKAKSQLVQAGSLASLDRIDKATIDSPDGVQRMPYGIEREVALMKLIDHPHVMKLYDIWENRTEM
jgi:serine/threonine-protein kinase HSL1 (negative regulator of Swe1 kinase)